MNSAHPVKRRGVHSHVVNSLGMRIVSGELPPSTVMTLHGLEADYQASRTVIREAVRVLESHGMLVSQRRVGITVQPMSNWDVLNESVIRWRLAGPEREQQIVELMELRSAIEPVAARLAAQRASDEQRGRLVDLAARMEQLGRQGKGDSEEFTQLDFDFHALLIEASSSPLLIRMMGPITEVITGRWVHHMLSGVPQAGTLEGHVAVAGAVKRGDGEAAGEASASLLEIVFDELRKA